MVNSFFPYRSARNPPRQLSSYTGKEHDRDQQVSSEKVIAPGDQERGEEGDGRKDRPGTEGGCSKQAPDWWQGMKRERGCA